MVERGLCGFLVLKTVEAEKEEELVLPVVDLRYDDWPAQSSGIVIGMARWLLRSISQLIGLGCVSCRFCCRDVAVILLLDEEPRAIPPLLPMLLSCCAVKALVPDFVITEMVMPVV